MNKIYNYVLDWGSILVSVLLVGSFLTRIDYSAMSVAFIVTSYSIGCISFIGAALSSEGLTVHRIVYIFTFFFFFLAPLQQRSNQVVFWSGQGLSVIYTDLDFVRANLMILLFLVIFEIIYRISAYFVSEHSPRLHQNSIDLSSKLTHFFMIIVIIAFGWQVANGNVFSGSSNGFQSTSSIQAQIMNVAKYLPVTILAMSIMLTKQGFKKNFKAHWVYWIALLTVCIIIFFPFNGTTSRFMMFGVYIFIAAILAERMRIRGPIFLFSVIGFFYIFSSFNIFKSGADFSQFRLSNSSVFSTVDFDAYQILIATMQYVHLHGSTHGLNILSAILCFLPRSIFSFRMNASGGIVANSFGSYFGNVSSPLVAEMFCRHALYTNPISSKSGK